MILILTPVKKKLLFEDLDFSFFYNKQKLPLDRIQYIDSCESEKQIFTRKNEN